jgi:hypothetical protein
MSGIHNGVARNPTKAASTNPYVDEDFGVELANTVYATRVDRRFLEKTPKEVYLKECCSNCPASTGCQINQLHVRCWLGVGAWPIIPQEKD